MKRPVQVVLLALTGLGLLDAALFTDIYLRYVKEGLRPLLIASGVLLLLLALAGAALDRNDHDHDHGHESAHGHDHSTAPRIAWLLFLPALSLLLYAPPALGAYSASRATDKVVKKQKEFDPLPAATSPLDDRLRHPGRPGRRLVSDPDHLHLLRGGRPVGQGPHQSPNKLSCTYCTTVVGRR